MTDNELFELFELVEKNEIKRLEQLLISHPEIINEDHEGSTLLSTAVNNNNLSAVKLLIDYKADLEITHMYDKDTVLILAVKFNNYEMAKLLIENGANVNHKNAAGNTGGHDALYYASSKSYFKMQDLLLKHGAEKTDFIDTSLIYASTEGDLDKVEQLLREKIDVNLRNYDGKSALMQACLGGHFEIAKKLIDNGADVNLMDYNYDYPHSEIIEEIIEGYVLFKTPLMRCVDVNNIDAISFLIDNGANIDMQTYQGETALMMAAKNANDKIAKKLIDNGADIYMTTHEEKTAFFYAITKGNVATVKIFGERKSIASVIDTEEYCSRTALMFASEYGNVEVVKYLLSVDFAGLGMGNGAWQGDDKGKTALIYASLNGHSKVVELLIEDYADNINDQDNESKTALIYACDNHHFDTVQLLLSKGVDINFVNRNGEVALKYPYDANDEEIVKLLLDNGANEKSMYDHDLNFIDHAYAYNKSKQWFIDIVRANPYALVKLLKEFSNDSLAFTNHELEAMTYEEFMNKVQDGWNIIDKSLKRQAPILHSNIEKFFFSEELGKKDTNGQVISWGENMTIGFSSPEIKKWCEDGYSLLDYDEEYTLRSIMANEFKNLIVIKDLESMIKTVVKKCKLEVEEAKYEISTNIDKIFTDVLEFKKLLKAIFHEIEKVNENPIKLKVTATSQETDKFVEVKIIHLASKSLKSANGQKEMGANFKNIKKISYPICYWSIDIECHDTYRYLIDYTFPKEEIKEDHCRKIGKTNEGFTYILRFEK